MSEPTAVDLALWQQALDAFEASLGHHRSTLSGRADAQLTPWPPPALPDGGVPRELRDRATSLLAEADQLTQQLLRTLAEADAPRRPRARRVKTDHPRLSITL